ncbi:hypothetical protein CERZMDRAFT_40982 [Cercospora zeae-maydis SCOH1-5]|uniref:Ferulic acid decarboxylase 1 n=1 Tax=Cercospora zeae-maydis SCOH1-5 TaxID=717836 RepID=A0A6A6FHP8_9PEZI|nr:hypothetical protein CERZMDRAFT_40982 [Cercospora zeae-maydis SCOH1-5]
MATDRMKAQLDFRTFIELLRHDGDLVDIKQQIDPHLEVGAIIRRVSELQEKAPLFSNIKGASDGVWRMFGNPASLSGHGKGQFGRIARTLGLPRDATWKQVCERTQAAKRLEPLKPKVLETGPCKENKIFGDDIDLHSLPAPFLHQRDGGKYLQTYGVNILSTPDRRWTNWSIFRGMIHSKNQLVCLVGQGQHNKLIREEWEKLGKTEMPWALALGVPPALSLAAALPLPKDLSEAEYIGALVGEPLEMVKCDTNDHLVPASSEIVLEGYTSLTERVPEGPFEDYMGLVFEGEGLMMPTFTVTAITYRDNPILPVSVPGRIVDESHTTSALASEELLELCRSHNLPIKDAFSPLETHATWCALQVDTAKLREMKTNSSDFMQLIGNLAFRDKSCMLVNRILLIGDDVDVQDFKNIIWAYSTRCRPGLDEYFFEELPGLHITPYMSQGRRDIWKGGKVVSDCLFPQEYEEERNFHTVSFETSYPEEIKSKVKENWVKMGFSKVEHE